MKASERSRRYRENDRTEPARSSLGHLVYEITFAGGTALAAGAAYLADVPYPTAIWWLLGGALAGLGIGWLIRRA